MTVFLAFVILPAQAHADILILAPHTDDDIITASGVIQRALQRGEAVRVVFVTNGDAAGVAAGAIRQNEAMAALAVLGLPENSVIFLGYPDGYLRTLRLDYPSGDAYTTPNGVSATYASRGLGGTDYHHYRFGVAGPYNWPTMVGDLSDLVGSTRPTHIFTTSEWDTHTDHATTYHLLAAAIANAIASNPGYNPTVHKTTVWPGDTSWPPAANPAAYFTELPRGAVTDPTEMVWNERESLDVPSVMQVQLSLRNLKYAAISKHASQGGNGGYIGRWTHKDEFFWTEQFTGTNRPPVPNAGIDQMVLEGALVTLDASSSWDRDGSALTQQWRQVGGPTVALPGASTAHPTFVAPSNLAADTTLEFELVVSDGILTSVPDAVRVRVHAASQPTWGANVAPLASFTASSGAQSAPAVADGIADGYPTAPTREWSSGGERAGAWIELTWPSAVAIGRIVLFDRPNTSDQVLGATVQFSDGSTVSVAALPNDGAPLDLTFTPRTVTSLRLTVTAVSTTTGNVGLAEFEVYEIGGNRPPTAAAGPDQIVAGGQVVTLNGSASADPDNDPLAYNWSQAAGTPVTLTGATSAISTFTAPAAVQNTQLLRFTLTVSDGQLTSLADTMDVRVLGTVNTPPVANAGPDTAVSAGATVTLDGSGSSDADGEPITYRWTQTSGTPVPLSSATIARPTFSVPSSAVDGELRFQLAVTDQRGSTTADSVTITVVSLPSPTDNIAPAATISASSENAPLQAAIKAVDGVVSGYPVDSSREWATAGQRAGAWIQLAWPQSRIVQRVRLHDRPNGNDQVLSGVLTFSDGTSVAVGALNNNSTAVDLVFVPRSVQWVRFTVATVSANTANIGLAEILVFEQPPTGNQSPIAQAGSPQTVTGGSLVRLDGTASSDPEGAPLTYSWTQVVGPTVTVSGATTATPTFTAPATTRLAQLLRFQLAVSDGTLTGTASVDITVAARPNLAPVANAGPDQNAVGGASVQLDGRASSDADGDATTYAWTQSGGPAVILTGATSAQPTFTAPAPQPHAQILAFQLVVNDGVASSAADVMIVFVQAQPDPANIAPLATISASTETLPNQGAVKAVDGVVSGYPTSPSNEWTTTQERVGAWIQLDWASDRTLDRVRLYDRVNPTDQITAATLIFSDGSSIAVGALPNSTETSLDVSFSPRTVRWMRLRVDSVSAQTGSTGLAEIEVFEPSTLPRITIGDATAVEGTSAVFTVTLSEASAQSVSVGYATADGTAVAPGDYTATSGTLTFAPGVTSRTITVAPANDLLNESNETFVVNLDAATNATIGDGQGVGTITDNDAAPTLSIGNVSVTETNPGVNATAVLTVTLSAPSGQPVTVSYATANDTAAAPGDYSAANGTLTFAPGVTSQTISVPVVGDSLDELNETFFVELSDPVNATIVDGHGVATITDNDAAPSLSIANASVTEGDTGTQSVTLTVTLSAASSRDVSVTLTTADATALSGVDYVGGGTSTITIAAGATSANIPLDIVMGDLLDEPNETFRVNLSAPVNATIGDGQSVVTITDNDPTPTLAIGDVTVSEPGTGSSTTATFTVTLSASSGRTVTVNYATANSTAVTPADYTALSGTLTFAPGVTTQTLSVTVNGDVLDEANETFVVNLTSSANATRADSQGVGTITDDDAPPALAIDDVAVTETNSGINTTATFTVTLSAVSGQTVTVNYATANGTAVAPGDYTARSGTLTFAPGVTSHTLAVTVIGDNMDEPNETFVLNLSTPVNVTVTDNQAVATINDNDAAPSLTIGDIAVTETNIGVNTIATFTARLSTASGLPITVNYATANGTAVEPNDYAARTGALTFAPGVTSQTVAITVIGDNLDEANETFVIDLSTPVNATIADPQGVATISDNDAMPSLAIGNVTLTEGNTGVNTTATFTVMLSTVSGRPVTVSYATANGTAAASADYAATSGSLTFAPGVTAQTVSVVVVGDELDEANETFVVNLSGAVNATVADSQGIGTITDDDELPTLSINSVSITEPDSGTVSLVFTVSLSTVSGRAVSVHYATANGTAVSSSDYNAASGTATLAAGTTTATIVVPVRGDTLLEGDESFFVNLSAAVNATIVAAQGTATILNDD